MKTADPGWLEDAPALGEDIPHQVVPLRLRDPPVLTAHLRVDRVGDDRINAAGAYVKRL